MAGILVGLVLLTRLPFRTQVLFNWDSANFALGMRAFDVTVHAPHPPGYLSYVALAKLFQQFLGDANASLVAESILFSALAVVALYWLGAALFTARTGLVAALLLTFSVTFWSYGEVALSYVSLAFFSAMAGKLAYETLWRGKDRLLALTAVYALAGGFRAELLVFLAPLWLLSLRASSPSRRTLAVALAGVGLLLWLGPTMWLSGGPREYWAVLSAYTQSDVVQRYSPAGQGWQALSVNLRDTLLYTFYALYAISLPLLGVAYTWLRAARRWFDQAHHQWPGPETRFLLIWLSPMIGFYLFIHIGDPGYVFSFLPGLLLLAAKFLVQDLPSLTSRASLAAVAVAVLLLINSGVFLFHPRVLTRWGLQRNDTVMTEKLSYLRETEPEQVLLLSYASYKHLRYYLPEHRQSIWVDLFDQRERTVPLSYGVSRIVLVDEELRRLVAEGEALESVSLPSGAALYLLPRQSGGSLRYSGVVIATGE